MGNADAVNLEAAWLCSFGDTLPALLAANGGPWDSIQAYATRTPASQKRQIFVTRRRFLTDRWSNQRRLPTSHLTLKCWWPIGATTTNSGIAEAEQLALDQAIDLLVTRIEGHIGDKSHGGRFLSVGEAPGGTSIDVDFGDPDAGIAAACLSATVSYLADGQDYPA